MPLNIGTDICQVSRIFRLLTGPRGTRFLHRVLTPEERAAASATQLRPLPAPAGPLDGGFEALRANYPEWWQRSTFVAGRCGIPSLFLTVFLLSEVPMRTSPGSWVKEKQAPE